MLGSITPLGDRSRGYRWTVSFGWFLAGSTAGGAALGGAAGLLGSALVGGGPSAALLAVLGLLTAASALSDLTGRAYRILRLTCRVNDDWLSRYRRWVCAEGFGAQLGACVATVVNTTSLYVAICAAVLSGSPARGSARGGPYGAVRGMTLLPARSARTPYAVGAPLARADRLRGKADLALIAVQLAAGAAMSTIGLLAL